MANASVFVEVKTIGKDKAVREIKTFAKEASSIIRLNEQIAHSAKSKAEQAFVRLANSMNKGREAVRNFNAQAKRQGMAFGEVTRAAQVYEKTLKGLEARAAAGKSITVELANAQNKLNATLGRAKREMADVKAAQIAKTRAEKEAIRVAKENRAALEKTRKAQFEQLKQMERHEKATRKTIVETAKFQAKMQSLTKTVQLAAGPLSGIASRISTFSAILNTANFAVASFISVIVGSLGIIHATKTAAASLDVMRKAAESTGLAFENFQGLQFAASQSAGIQDATQALVNFSKNLGDASTKSGEAVSIFQSLGIELRGIGQRDTIDVFLEVADKVSNLASATEKASVAAKLFGTDNMQFVKLLSEGRKGLEAYIQTAKDYGIIVDEAIIKKATRVVDAADLMSRSIGQNVKSALIENFAVPVENLFLMLAKVGPGIKEYSTAIAAGITGIGAALATFSGLKFITFLTGFAFAAPVAAAIVVTIGAIVGAITYAIGNIKELGAYIANLGKEISIALKEPQNAADGLMAKQEQLREKIQGLKTLISDTQNKASAGLVPQERVEKLKASLVGLQKELAEVNKKIAEGGSEELPGFGNAIRRVGEALGKLGEESPTEETLGTGALDKTTKYLQAYNDELTQTQEKLAGIQRGERNFEPLLEMGLKIQTQFAEVNQAAVDLIPILNALRLGDNFKGLNQFTATQQKIIDKARKILQLQKDIVVATNELALSDQLETLESQYDVMKKYTGEAKEQNAIAELHLKALFRGQAVTEKELELTKKIVAEEIKINNLRVLRELDEQLTQAEGLFGFATKSRYEFELQNKLLAKQADLRKRNIDLGSDQALQELKKTEQIFATEKATENLTSAIDTVSDKATEMWLSMYEDGTSTFKDLAKSLKTTMLSVLADIAKEALIRPIVAPIVAGVLGQVPISMGGTAGAGGGTGSNLMSGLSAASNFLGGGPGGLATSFAKSGFGSALGLSQPASAAMSASAAMGDVGFMTAAQASSSALTSAGSMLVAAAPYIAAAAAIALPLIMGMFGGQPSVGPVGIADFSPGLGRNKAFDVPGITPFTADNNGNPQAMKPIAEAIADLIADTADRFEATIEQSLRFRVANYASPEGGSGRMAGFEVNAFIRGQAEKRVAEGLSQEQAMFEALKYAVQEAFTFNSETLAEIAKNTTASTTEALIADLEFGMKFDTLREAIEDLGGEINLNSLESAKNTLALKTAAETFVSESVSPINEALKKAMELFPAIAEEVAGTATGKNKMAPSGQNALAGVSFAYDEGGLRGGRQGFTFTQNTDQASGRGNNFGTFDVDGKAYDVLTSQGGEGVIFDLVNNAGEVIGSFENINDLMAEVGDTINDFIDSVSASAGRTAEETARHQANMERVAFSINLAKVSFDEIINTITGEFEPTVRGPFQKALESGTANITAMSTEFEDFNDLVRKAYEDFPELTTTLGELSTVLIDTTSVINTAIDTLRSQLQDQFLQDLQSQYNASAGLSSINTIQDIIDMRDQNLAEAAALGITLNAQQQKMINDIFTNQITSAVESIDVADLFDALVNAQATFTDSAALSAFSLAIGDKARQADMKNLITDKEAEATAIEKVIEAAKNFEYSLNAAADALLLDTNLSPLSPEDMLAEARQQYAEMLALAQGDPTLDTTQKALQDLPNMSRSFLTASQAYYGNSENYLSDFNKVQDDLHALAETQVSIQQQQLLALVGIQTEIANLNTNLGGGARYTQVSGTNQYISTAASGIGAGVDLGKKPESNLLIAKALISAGISFPGAGEGQLNTLRQTNPLADQIMKNLGFAKGGVTPGGTVMVGEVGPELVDLPAGSRVHSNASTSEMMGSITAAVDRLTEVTAVGQETLIKENRALRQEMKKLNDRLRVLEGRAA